MDKVLVFFSPDVDGWIQAERRVARRWEGQQHALMIWMEQRSWQHLATHANIDGLWYIPAGLLFPTAKSLRTEVQKMESPNVQHANRSV